MYKGNHGILYIGLYRIGPYKYWYVYIFCVYVYLLCSGHLLDTYCTACVLAQVTTRAEDKVPLCFLYKVLAAWGGDHDGSLVSPFRNFQWYPLVTNTNVREVAKNSKSLWKRENLWIRLAALQIARNSEKFPAHGGPATSWCCNVVWHCELPCRISTARRSQPGVAGSHL
jgi:hypothetical protein